MNAVKRKPVSSLTAKATCRHCGLPVPPGLIVAESNDQFCCSGCKTAFAIIHANGLDAFYSMAESFSPKRDGADSVEPFNEYDQPEFQRQFSKTIDSQAREITFSLSGLHCAACIWLIEKLPQIEEGVVCVQVSWARQTATIRWQSEIVLLSRIARTLQKLGYTPHPVRENRDQQRRHDNRQHLIRIGVAAAAAGNNMIIAAALYLGMFSFMSIEMTHLLRVASCVVGLVALLLPGQVFLRGAWNSIRTRTPHMDLPIALGLLVGSIAGLVNTIRGSGEIYFDSLSVLIFLLLVGRWIQFRQQNRATDSLEMLYQLTPQRTRKMVAGRAVDTFVETVQPDDLLEIRCDDLLPVDAVIVQGSSSFDESLLNGESKQVVKSQGQNVLAGTRNCESRVIVRATATGRDTRLSKIVALVEKATLEKPQIVQWADQIGGYFVAVVIALAVVTLAAWIWTDATAAVSRTVALLIVACPCALAIATPLAISVALGRAANQKIMIKGGDVLQALNRPGTIWLDKTGTITHGNLEVVQWHGDRDYLAEIYALEKNSGHPVARAMLAFAAAEGYAPENSSTVDGNTNVYPGAGISGFVNERDVIIGSQKLMRLKQVAINKCWLSIAAEILENQMAPCWTAVDGKIVAVAAVGDRIRDDAEWAIGELKKTGWKVGILSGDHQQIVDQVAGRLRIDPRLAIGGVSPEEKLGLIKQSCTDNDSVVMVGDGVNDCAALAAATVGIAVHKGAEASLAAAPVFLAKEGLRPIIDLMALASSTKRKMRINLGISLTYNVLFASAAFLGAINPLVAAIIMPISSLSVVAISLVGGSRAGSTEQRV